MADPALRQRVWQWAALLALSMAITGIANAIQLPAALMIGPMIAGVVVGTTGGVIRVPNAGFIAAQGIIGCMVGRSIPLSFVNEIAKDWPIFLAGIFSVIAAASAIGLALSRLAVLPGTTAIWGTSPGASTSMIVMAEAYGGDMRLVALMQQLRVIAVAFSATLVAKLWIGSGSPPPPQVAWLEPVAPLSLLATFAVAGGGAWLAMRLRVPAGAMLMPMLGVILLHETGLVEVALPPWLLAACYAIVGWSVGLRFTRPLLAHAFRALPAILASIVVLIATCGLIALAMVRLGGIDPLTAYLATSPGGLDTVAIVAAASPVDLRFVMAMQTTRLVAALVTSPIISRIIAKRELSRDAART